MSTDTTKTEQQQQAERAGLLSADEPMRRGGMDWFVLRVASNKENWVRETLLRKVQIEKMEHLVGRILVPTEKTKTIKGGKQRIVESKLYPGYVFVEMQLEATGGSRKTCSSSSRRPRAWATSWTRRGGPRR